MFGDRSLGRYYDCPVAAGDFRSLEGNVPTLGRYSGLYLLPNGQKPDVSLSITLNSGGTTSQNGDQGMSHFEMPQQRYRRQISTFGES